MVQRADALVIEVHRLASRRARQLSQLSPGLRNQLLRAVVSVSANLGEACGPHSPQKAASQIDIAIGSLNEVERMLTLMQQLGALGEDAGERIRDTQQVRALAYGFRRRVLGTLRPQDPDRTSDLSARDRLRRPDGFRVLMSDDLGLLLSHAPNPAPPPSRGCTARGAAAGLRACA
ncbi:MAG: four helix bundle protein [Gemmatimonadaceae bacterium]|nr:four helix bundle protein [Gemmatimonadaceae bacterium]